MVELELGNAKFKDVPAELATAINVEIKTLTSDKTRLDSQVADLQQQLETAKKTAETATARADTLQSQVNDRQDASEVEKEINQRVQQRLDLLDKARKHLGKDYKCDSSVSNLEIKKAILANKGMEKSLYDSYNEDQLNTAIETLEQLNLQRDNYYQSQTKAINSLNIPSREDELKEDEIEDPYVKAFNSRLTSIVQ